VARPPRGHALGARAELEQDGATAIRSLAAQQGAQAVRAGGAGAVEQHADGHRLRVGGELLVDGERGRRRRRRAGAGRELRQPDVDRRGERGDQHDRRHELDRAEPARVDPGEARGGGAGDHERAAGQPQAHVAEPAHRGAPAVVEHEAAARRVIWRTDDQRHDVPVRLGQYGHVLGRPAAREQPQRARQAGALEREAEGGQRGGDQPGERPHHRGEAAARAEQRRERHRPRPARPHPDGVGPRLMAPLAKVPLKPHGGPALRVGPAAAATDRGQALDRLPDVHPLEHGNQ